MDQCIFCGIVAKQIPSTFVYEDDSTIAILDINPANKGHTLVMPKTHAETLMDIQSEELKKLIDTVQRVANGLMKALNAEGINVLQNNKQVAGQAIPHIHFHVIPRFNEDGLHLGVLRQEKMGDDELKAVAEQIRNNIEVKKIEEVKEPEEKPVEKSKKRTKDEIYWMRRELDLA